MFPVLLSGNFDEETDRPVIMSVNPAATVQVGINDTILTKAIENGEFREAEKIILENQDPAFLDDGFSERIPLALVLSGEYGFRNYPRNLKLAKLLIEGGANPNLRIPVFEMQGATNSPLELVVELYFHICDIINFGEEYEGRLNMVHPSHTIGLNDERDLKPHELKKQVLLLLDIFLAHGGNPNVTTRVANSTLFHIVLANSNPDMELVKKLCEAGGDMNQTNFHGTTPLMDLVMKCGSDDALSIIRWIWRCRPDISTLNAVNCSNETALWCAMHAGSPSTSVELLNLGAKPCTRAKLRRGLFERQCVQRYSYGALQDVSALFAPLLQNSHSYISYSTVWSCMIPDAAFNINFHVDLLNKVMSSVISPIVDSTYLSEALPESVLKELETIILTETNFFVEGLCSFNISLQSLFVLMFGQQKAGLQQLCIRQVLHKVLFSGDLNQVYLLLKSYNTTDSVDSLLKTKDDLIKEIKPYFLNEEAVWYMDDEDFSDFSGGNSNRVDDKDTIPSLPLFPICKLSLMQTYKEDINDVMIINELTPKSVFHLVTSHLNLPSALVHRFQIEAARLQIGANIFLFESADCLQDCDIDTEPSTDLFDDDYDIDDDDNFDIADDDEDDDISNWRDYIQTSEKGPLYGFDPDENTTEDEFSTYSFGSSSPTYEDALVPVSIELQTFSEEKNQMAESDDSKNSDDSMSKKWKDVYEELSDEVWSD